MTRVAPPKVRVSRLPPARIKGTARFATSVKEKAEITIVRMKFSRLVSAYNPVRSAVAEEAPQWTTKSSSPQLDLSVSNTASTKARSSTSQGKTMDEPSLAARGL